MPCTRHSRRPQTVFKPLLQKQGNCARQIYFLLFITTSYYAATYITQGEEVFSCTWDFSCEDVNNPTRKELINHLAEMIEEHNNDFTDGWERDDDVRLNLFEMTPYEFAKELVMNEAQSADHYDTHWKINVSSDETDSENWEHPCNL